MTAPRFRPVSLDALNFLLADVRGALGPYLNVFLVTQQGWSQSSVGLVTAIGGLISLAVQTPVGAAIDATRAKRVVITIALAVLGCGAFVIFAAPSFWPQAKPCASASVSGSAPTTFFVSARKVLAPISAGSSASRCSPAGSDRGFRSA